MTDRPANQIGQHVPQMYRVACRMLNAEKAHDVVQEACLRALSSIDRFDGRAELSSWLYRITVNCAKDAIRNESRKENVRRGYAVKLAGQLGVRSGGGGGDGSSQFASGSDADSPAELAEEREMAGVAWSLLESLPEDCRAAFVLTQLDGYSYSAVSEIEGLPRGTIATRVHRAKKILLAEMKARTGGAQQ